MKNTYITIGRRLLIAGAIATLPLKAQQDPTAAPADPAVELKPVIVTATLREEPLQEVPVSVSVVDGASAQQADLNTIFDISSEVPSLTFRDNASEKDTSLVIRGIGTVTTTLGADPSVSTVVDGVVLARSGQAATLDLLDVDRIEVLRGPQGTLFGKNASAGVVNVVTNDPSTEPSSYIDTSYFEGDEFRFRAGVATEISPGLAALSVNGLFGYYGGNVTNDFNGEKVNGYQKEGGRAKLVLTPNKNLKITLIADLLHTYETTPLVPVVAGAYTATAPLTFSFAPNPAYAALVLPEVPSPNNTQINNSYKSYDQDLNYGYTAIAEEKLDHYAITSITGYRNWRNDQYQDLDRAPTDTASFPFEHDIGHVDLYQTSEELRLATLDKGLIEYVTGLYYDYVSDSETYQRNDTQIVGGNSVSNYGRSVYGTTDTNDSVFGEATINFTSNFRAIAGVRLIRDGIDFEETRYSTSAATIPGIKPSDQGSGSSDASGVSARTGLQFDISKNVSSYLTYSRGYKGPAYDVFFNYASATDSAPVVAETSDSFEAGLKSTLVDSRLVANIDAFYTNYDNYQTNYYQLVDGVFVNHLVNAGTVNTRGIEGDLTAKASPALTLRLSFTALRARIVDFALPAGTPAQDGVNGGRLPFAPDFKSSASADYRAPLGKTYTLDFGTDFTWQSYQLYDIGQSPGLSQSAYGILNGSITLRNAAYHWYLSLIVKNIGNVSYAEFLSPGTGNIGSLVPRDDRTYFGFNLHKEF